MAPQPQDPAGLTSMHLRQARRGDRDSLEWLVARLTPLLVTQARYRLRGRLTRHVDPEDVVGDVWAIALPRLGDLEPRAGRETPVLLAFLSRTLLQHVNNLTRKEIRRQAQGDEPGSEAPDRASTGVATRVAKDDASERLLAVIAELPEAQREVLVLRGIEQHELADVAQLLGITPNAVAQRWARALATLRERLPASIADELTD